MSCMTCPRQVLINGRKAKQLTQQELADLTGITRSFLANLETGRYSPSLRVAFALSHAVGRKVEDLFPEETAPLKKEIHASPESNRLP